MTTKRTKDEEPKRPTFPPDVAAQRRRWGLPVTPEEFVAYERGEMTDRPLTLATVVRSLRAIKTRNERFKASMNALADEIEARGVVPPQPQLVARMGAAAAAAAPQLPAPTPAPVPSESPPEESDTPVPASPPPRPGLQGADYEAFGRLLAKVAAACALTPPPRTLIYEYAVGLEDIPFATLEAALLAATFRGPFPSVATLRALAGADG